MIYKIYVVDAKPRGVLMHVNIKFNHFLKPRYTLYMWTYCTLKAKGLMMATE